MTACGANIHSRQAYVFGTLVQISVYNNPKADSAISAVFRDFDSLHQLLDPRQDSELAQVNTAIRTQSTPVHISETLKTILLDVAAYARQTNHTFNPAIGNLIGRWGFYRDTFTPDDVPDAHELEALVSNNPTMDDIQITGNSLSCTNPSVQLDLGGYVKGLALDRAARILKDHGIKNALINIGGNVLALGSKQGKAWIVAIRHPRGHGVFATLELADGEAIGTSGDYQRFYMVDGVRYHHLINPKTGYPASEVAAVTIVTKGRLAGVRSDVLSKPLFIGGMTAYEQDDQVANMISDVVFTDLDGRHHVSASMSKRLHFLNGQKPVRILGNDPK